MAGQPHFKNVRGKIAGIPIWILILGYISLVIMPIINTLLHSFSKGWFSGVLPAGWTTLWYERTLEVWDLGPCIITTVLVAILVVVFSIALTFPAAYLLARKEFRGKSVVTLLFLLPLLLPPLTYGIPVARIIYFFGLANKVPGIVMIQLLPIAPYVLLMLRGVIGGIPPALEEQAFTLGANRFQVFRKVVFPLIRPGIIAAACWSIAKSISEFGLTFLVAGPGAMPISIVLFSAFQASGTLQTDISALTMWLVIPSFIFIGLTMKFMKAETISMKGI